MIIDSHCHVGFDYYDVVVRKIQKLSQSLVELENRLSYNGVDAAIVFPFPSNGSNVCTNDSCPKVKPLKLISRNEKDVTYECPDCKNLYKLSEDPYYSSNIKLLNDVAGNAKFIPFVSIDPRFPSCKYLERIIGKADGVKLHTYVCDSSLDDLLTTDYFDLLNSRELPIIVHSGGDAKSLPENALKFSDNYSGDIIIAHAARLNDKFLEKIKTYDNIFIDSSLITGLFRDRKTRKSMLDEKLANNIVTIDDLLAFLLDACGANSIVFGTDSPYCEVYGDGYEQELSSILKSTRISNGEKSKILSENITKILRT